jgi:hypothetical protein
VKPATALVLGAVTVAVVEAVETSLFWWWYRKVTPWQIFQYITSGLLGRPAFEGGAATVWLGIALHFFNASVIVAVYLLASQRWKTLVRHPVAWGLAYGAGVHLVMSHVVIPLSVARKGQFSWFLLVHSLVSQAVTVGLPTAFFARAASHGDAKAKPLPAAAPAR